MKYCPYCGADFADGAASFCMECGKSLPIVEGGQKKPKEKPVKSQKRMEKKRKHPSPKPRKKHEKPVGEHVGGAFHPKDDGYDGYYDDVLPSVFMTISLLSSEKCELYIKNLYTDFLPD